MQPRSENKENDILVVEDESCQSGTGGNVTVRAGHRRLHWQSRKRSGPAGSEPREWLPSGEGCQPTAGECWEGCCCQLEWTAQDLPPRERARARSTPFRPLPPAVVVIVVVVVVVSPAQFSLSLFTYPRAGFKLHGSLICRPVSTSSLFLSRCPRKRKNHLLALLVEAYAAGSYREVGRKAADITADLPDVQMFSLHTTRTPRRELGSFDGATGMMNFLDGDMTLGLCIISLCEGIFETTLNYVFEKNEMSLRCMRNTVLIKNTKSESIFLYLCERRLLKS